MHFTLLPDEVMLHIFNEVFANNGISALSALARVNNRWNRISMDDSLWTLLYQKMFGTRIRVEDTRLQYKRMNTFFRSNGPKLYQMDCMGSNVLHLNSKLRWNTEIMQTLLFHGIDATERNFLGQTPLHTAIEASNESTVDVLLRHNAALANMVDHQGRTGLHLAAGKGLHSICLLLLQSGALPISIDVQGQTPLHHAAKYGRIRSCRLLAPFYGRNIDLADLNGNTALLLAATTNKEQCMRILIEEFSANSMTADKQGRTIMDSVLRLMPQSAIHWTETQQVWGNQVLSTCKAFDLAEEHQEWDRIAIEQKKQFIMANRSPMVHYH